MGSKISVQDIDQKASDFAKANFMKQLKEHHQNLEKENKELKEEISEMNTYGNRILKENKHYKEANANLKKENKEYKHTNF